MPPEVLPMTIEGKTWPNEFPRAGYQGIGCNACATDFARTDSNIFICTECVAWLLIRLSWHKSARSTDLCACLPQCMKPRRLVERTVPKTRRFELVSRCFTWDPQPRSSHQHPNVASCYSGGVGELQAKAKDILWKIKGALLFVCSDAVIFAISAVSCLTWWTHMLSCWASGPQTSCWGWRHHCTTTQQNKQLASLVKLKPWDL